MTDPVHELCLADIERDDIGHDSVIDALDAASGQDRTTWITDPDGKRVAKIAPVDEIPDLVNRVRDEELAELLGFAGQVRAAMRATREAYDALFGAAGARLLRAGAPPGRVSLRAGAPSYPLVQGQDVLFIRLAQGSSWENGTFTRYSDDASEAILTDAGGHSVIIDRRRVIPAGPAPRTGPSRTCKRAETGPVWQQAMAASEPERLLVSRDLLSQVLIDAGLITDVRNGPDTIEAVWEALRDRIQGTHPERSGQPEDRPERVCISCEQPEGQPHLPTCITRTGTLRPPAGS